MVKNLVENCTCLFPRVRCDAAKEKKLRILEYIQCSPTMYRWGSVIHHLHCGVGGYKATGEIQAGHLVGGLVESHVDLDGAANDQVGVGLNHAHKFALLFLGPTGSVLPALQMVLPCAEIDINRHC